MMINLSDLLPNQKRDFDIYPMDPAQVARLSHSINELGFFQGVSARPHPKVPGKYELACGHHRIEAAKMAGLTKLDINVRDYTDVEMARIMIAENMTQRHVSAPAVNDSVACAVKLVVEEVFTDQKFLSGSDARSAGNQRDEILKDGPGEGSLFEAVNGFNYRKGSKEQRAASLLPMGELRNGIATLKAGGWMTKFVQAAYEDAKAKASAELEAKRQAEEARIAAELAAAEAERQAAEARAKREAEEAARKVEELKRSAAKAASAAERKALSGPLTAAEAVRETAIDHVRETQGDYAARLKAREIELDAIKAERAEAAKREQTERKKLSEQSKFAPTYDIRCSKLFTNTDQEKTFRNWIIKHTEDAQKFGMKPMISIDNQYSVAMEIREAMLVSKKKTGLDPGAIFIARWLNEKISELVSFDRQVSKQQKEELLKSSAKLRVQDYWKSLQRYVNQSENFLTKIVEAQREWPYEDEEFPVDRDVLVLLTLVSSSIAKLNERLTRPDGGKPKNEATKPPLRIVSK